MRSECEAMENRGENMSLLSAKEIMEIIPHRQPFMLIDTIEEMEPGVRAVGKKCVSYNEPYFAGHFPGEPVMPGVLIIEALAPDRGSGNSLIAGKSGENRLFCRNNSAKFKQKVVPGDVLTLETEIVKIKGPIGVGKATATVNGKVAAIAELVFAIGKGE